MTVTVPINTTPAPSRLDTTNFATRADAYHAWLPTAVAAMNAQNVENNTLTVAATTASASAVSAAAVVTVNNPIANAAAAAASATAAAASALASATSTSAASAAKDAAIAAWSASTAPTEQLSAISKSLHVGTVVKSIIYDTSKDSDGGAWRKRMQDKSWYTEALGGDRWIGQQATIAAAWTAAGSVTGAVFQATATAGPLTVGKYYSATSSTTATEVFRGISREFPAVVAIVAEAGRVVIYDLTVSSCPMWMVFVGNVANQLVSSTGIGSIAALNGIVAIGNSGSSGAIEFFRFINDYTDWIYLGGLRKFGGAISSRNAGLSFYQVSTTPAIVNNTVNDVAITALDTAPIDPATGLPVPTIAVATAGGVSVIKDDGTVVNSNRTEDISNVRYDKRSGLFWSHSGGTDVYFAANPSTAGFTHNQTFWATTIPGGVTTTSAKLASLKDSTQAISLASGVALLKQNFATVAKGMVSYITTAYNTGWLPGDIRGAYLADATAETITDGTGTELVTNGTFTTDTTGWAAANATLSSVSSALRITATGASSATAFQSISGLSVGRIYSVSVTFAAGTTGSGTLSLGLGAVNGADYLSIGLNAGVNTFTFKATGTTLGVTLSNDSGSAGLYSTFDSVSCKLTNELVANGTNPTATTGWTLPAGTLLVAAGEFTVTSTASGTISAIQTITGMVVGKTYSIGGYSRGTASQLAKIDVYDGAVQSTYSSAFATNVSATGSFIAKATSVDVKLKFEATASGQTAFFNGISVKLADPDRSVKNTGLVLNGTLTKTAVASGAGLVAYSGFSANTNYLSQSYSPNFDFGTGDFAYGFWTDASASGVLFTRGNGTSAGSLMWYHNGGGLTAALYIHDGTSLSARLTVTLPAGLSNIWITRSGTALNVYSNGVLLGTATSALTVSNAAAILQIGNRQDASQAYGGWVSLFRISATAPTADQISHIYRTELPLFQPNAQCTLAGTSTAVTALAYDAPTDTLHAGTSWGRTSFRDLLRTDSEATTTGSITSLSSNYGTILTGGTSAKVYVPSLLLRDEIAKPNPVASQPQPYRQWSIKDQQVFSSQTGVKIVGVYIRGVLKKLGIDYTVAYDGFRYIVTTTDKLASRTEVTFLQIKE